MRSKKGNESECLHCIVAGYLSLRSNNRKSKAALSYGQCTRWAKPLQYRHGLSIVNGSYNRLIFPGTWSGRRANDQTVANSMNNEYGNPLTGDLQYLTFTRPDITYVAHPLVAPHQGIMYSSEIIFLSWSSKRQHTISRSNVEAEYRGVANVVAETA
nr:hypothetical protein [Tanacetum cinerariifolium]